jgi:acyl dehydratase
MKRPAPETTYGRITEEGIERLRARIGTREERNTPPFLRVLNEDAIRNWARGIGDVNPLYSDPGYARSSIHRSLLASPSILYATDNVVSGAVAGLPGVHAMFAGTEWEWLRPLREDDRIDSASWLDDLVEKQTRFAGRALQEIYRVEFHAGGELVARARSWCFRTERDVAREQGTKYAERAGHEPHVYSQDELERIAEAYDRERVDLRGAEPRHFEETEVGESLPGLARGPYTLTTAVGFMQCWGAYAIFSHGRAFDYYRKHPFAGPLNEYGVPELPVRVHWDPGFARTVGAPGAYDFGPERCSWLVSYVSNWMGDDAHLRAHSSRIRYHNCVGDTTWFTGKVVGKREEGGAGLVELELAAHNQDGQLTTEGTALVELPRRDARP